MIPYIHVPDLKIGPLTLHPFGLLVATGVILGAWLAVRRGRARGLDVDQLNSFITWMLVAGFLGGHMLDQIFYHPAELVKRPWSLLLLYEGLSSFGGFTGALIGIILWKYFEAVPIGKIPFLGFTISKYRRRKVAPPILPFADIVLSVFPVAWVFGRSGCSVVHDHPGMHAEPGTLVAVMFPDHSTINALQRAGKFALVQGTIPQFDLGLLEMMFTVILASLIALTWSRKLTTGTYVAVTALAYAPVRFAMDYLRIKGVEQADPRYGGLTPAQWSSVALFVFGLVMVWKIQQIKKSGKDPQDTFLALPAPAVPEDTVESQSA
jgi:phosphatidylglycerol:prolipoprotein diacylglycerol transferase